MSTVLLASFGTAGDLLPFARIAQRLNRRGARAVMLCPPGSRLPPDVETRPVGPALDFDQEIRERPELMGPSGGTIVIRDYYRRFNEALAPVAVEAIEELDPVCVAAHAACPGLRWAARRQGLPEWTVHLAPPSLFSRHALGHMPWAMGLAMRLFLPLGMWAMTRWYRPLAARWDDPLPQGMRGLMVPEHRLVGLWSRAFCDGPLPDAAVHPLGFPRPDQATLPAPIEAFLAAGEPPLAIALGTSAVHVAGRLVPRLVAAAAARGLRCIVLGEVTLPADKGVLVQPWADYGALFPRCRAVVHHAGIGTAAAAMASGRPALLVPFAHDQPDNAWRIAGLGLGVVASPRASARRLGAALDRVLLPDLDQQARVFAARLADDIDGADALAGLLLAPPT
ncbi:MAG: glycosyltransferase family 1 protein [Alphaproteobacteria bacterium]|nr:glycosyltransferase family 1 protein [Alphaproteobacteria bacterium]